MKRLVTALIGLLLSQPSTAELSPATIAMNCRNCHSQNAQDSQPLSLSLQSAQEIRSKLLEFKYNPKNATLMPRIVKAYSDEELSAVADYLGQH
jgi:cytochrome c553